MASQQLLPFARVLRSRRSLGALVVGSVTGAIIAMMNISEGDESSQEVTTAVSDTEMADTQVAEMAAPETAVPEEETPATPAPFDYGECPPEARACVDLDTERAWLQENGELSFGPVSVGQGGVGYATPRDTFQVSRKVEFDVSIPFDNAPMPFAVYFTNQGHAFHEGDPEGDSHGCVRLPEGVAEHFFNELQVYDKVFIY